MTLKLFLILLSMSDVELLATLICSECSICSIEEKELVASVVINRQKSRSKSLKHVILERNQFHGITKKVKPSSEDWIIAGKMLMHGSTNKEVEYFYLRNSPNKKWRNSLKIINKQPFHNFCKLKSNVKNRKR